jgi:hypothetical protein
MNPKYHPDSLGGSAPISNKHPTQVKSFLKSKKALGQKC